MGTGEREREKERRDGCTNSYIYRWLRVHLPHVEHSTYTICFHSGKSNEIHTKPFVLSEFWQFLLEIISQINFLIQIDELAQSLIYCSNCIRYAKIRKYCKYIEETALHQTQCSQKEPDANKQRDYLKCFYNTERARDRVLMNKCGVVCVCVCVYTNHRLYEPREP